MEVPFLKLFVRSGGDSQGVIQPLLSSAIETLVSGDTKVLRTMYLMSVRLHSGTSESTPEVSSRDLSVSFALKRECCGCQRVTSGLVCVRDQEYGTRRDVDVPSQ